MNARQAAREAAKHIEKIEDFNRRCTRDIKAYNACIDGMIAGETPCKWCEEYDECQLEARDGKGCDLWWLLDLDKKPSPNGEAELQPEPKLDGGKKVYAEAEDFVKGYLPE